MNTHNSSKPVGADKFDDIFRAFQSKILPILKGQSLALAATVPIVIDPATLA